jgi:hypothetical protein
VVNHYKIRWVDCVDRIDAEAHLIDVPLENVKVLTQAAHEIVI